MVCADGSVVTLGGGSLDQVGPDLRAVIVGSEGTVGIVTEIIVRLLREPEAADRRRGEKSRLVHRTGRYPSEPIVLIRPWPGGSGRRSAAQVAGGNAARWH